MKTCLLSSFSLIVLALSLESATAHEPQTLGEAVRDGIVSGAGGDPGAYDRGFRDGLDAANTGWLDGYDAGSGMTPGPYEVPAGGLYDGGLLDSLGGGLIDSLGSGGDGRVRDHGGLLERWPRSSALYQSHR